MRTIGRNHCPVESIDSMADLFNLATATDGCSCVHHGGDIRCCVCSPPSFLHILGRLLTLPACDPSSPNWAIPQAAENLLVRFATRLTGTAPQPGSSLWSTQSTGLCRANTIASPAGSSTTIEAAIETSRAAYPYLISLSRPSLSCSWTGTTAALGMPQVFVYKSLRVCKSVRSFV